MTDPDDEHEFQAFLKRRTLLPNAMRADEQLEPPVALDASVLKRARESIPTGKQPHKAARWALPVALAATILLCLSVVLNVSLNTNRPTAGGAERREIVNGDIPSGEVILPETKLVGPVPPQSSVIDQVAAAPPAQNDRERPTDSAADKAASFTARAGVAPPHPADPKTWLRQIDALRAAGKTAQADAELRRFQAVFPSYATKPVAPASFESPK